MVASETNFAIGTELIRAARNALLEIRKSLRSLGTKAESARVAA